MSVVWGAGLPRMPGTRSIGRRGKVVSTALLGAVILAAQLFPDLPVYLGLVGSIAVGTMAVASAALLATGIVWLMESKRGGRRWDSADATGVLVAIAIIAIVVIHGLIVDVIAPLDFRRFLASLGPLIFLLGGALAMGHLMQLATRRQMIAVAWLSFSVCCLFLIERLLKLEPLATRFNAATFPFTERSTFALAFGPVLIYSSAAVKGVNRTIWVLFWLGIAVIFKNATMVAFVLLSAAVARRTVMISALIVLVLAAGLARNLKYFTSRADLSSHSTNISALVYLQGWELLGESMRVSDGWGLGFQQMGVRNLDLPVSQAIATLDAGAGYLNLQDGSFLLSKLASEFGVLGLALIAGYCALAMRCFRYLRAGSAGQHDGFAHAIVLGFAVDIFVRGVGYFSGYSLLFLAALLSLMLFRNVGDAASSKTFASVRVP